MANIKLVGAVAIKVRPDAKGFRRELDGQIDDELKGFAPTVEVKVKVKADTSQAKKDGKEAKDEIEKKALTLKVGLDHDSIVRAQKELRAAVKHLADEVIVIDFDVDGSLEDAERRLEEMRAGAKVEMQWAPDEQGFKDVLAKIAQIRREKILQLVEFDTDDESLNRMEKAAKKALRETAVITVSYNNNRSSLTAALDQIKAEQAKLKVFEFDVLVNKKGLKEARKDIEEQLANAPVELTIDYKDQESIKRTRARLQEMLNEVRGTALPVKFNEEEISAEISRLNSMIDDEVVKEHKVDLPVYASRLELVARQLQFASRARRVPFFVVIDAKSVAIAEGILRSLAGVNTLESVGRGLESVITKFDTFSLKTAAWSTGIAALVNTFTYMTSALFTIGDGMFEVVGLAALAPAAFASLATVVFVAASVFKDFGAAVHGIDAALKRLPASGQKAALLIRKVFADMRESISVEFWGKASDAMLAFSERTLPVFSEGLSRVAGEMGRIFAGILDSFTKSADSGQLQIMFDNLVKMLDNAVRGTTALWDAFNILGIRGSEFLPKFGTWLSDISVRFKEWVEQADKTGDITAWIEDGITSLKDMFFATGAIIDQFKALARAAGLIGENGLDDFRRNMEHIARVMLAEPFQTKMGSIFFGARRGASELNVGIKDLARSFSDAAFWTGQVLTLLGQLGGGFLTGLSQAFGRATFQQGQLDVLKALNEMLIEMKPAFENLGDVMGRFSTIASGVFRNLGPVFNTVMRILDTAVERLQTNLERIAPSLLTLTNNLLSFAQFPLMLLVDALNGLLTVLNWLPGPLRDAALAFGTFLLLRNQFGAFGSMLSNLWTNMTTSVVRGSAAITAATTRLGQDLNNNVTSRYRMMADGSIREMNRLGTATARGMGGIRTDLARPINVTAVSSGLAAEVPRTVTMVGRLNGALSLIGGIPGLVLGAIGVAIATIGSNAATASAEVDKLAGMLDKATGKMTVDGVSQIAINISEIGEAGDAWANFWRGVMENSAAGNETLERLGINVNDLAKAMANDPAAAKVYIDQLKALQDIPNLELVAKFARDGSLPTGMGPTTANQGALKSQGEILKQIVKDREKLGTFDPNLFIGPDAIQMDSLDHVVEVLGEEERKLKGINDAWRLKADLLGLSVGKAKEVEAMVAVLRDTSMDAANQIDAIRRSIELLGGGDLSETEAKIAQADALERAVENAKALKTSIDAARQAGELFKDGVLNIDSKAGRDLHKIMREQSDFVLQTAKGAYNTAIQNNQTVEVALAAADQAIKNGAGNMKQIAEAAGTTVEEMEATWGRFFGEEWVLHATFTGTTDLFQQAMKMATDMGIEFDGAAFEAFLMADGDPANETTTQIRQYMEKYAEGVYQATLTAIPDEAAATLRALLGIVDDQWNKGNFEAILKAAKHIPGLAEALAAFMRVANGPRDAGYEAAFKALLDAISAANTRAQLDAIANQKRVAVIAVRYSDPGAGSPGTAAKGLSFAVANGGIIKGNIKQFANGGIEHHVAQISRRNGPIRIWGEPETQGEAYVPLAASKRPRSVQILKEVATRFGYQLSKAQQFADGGTASAVPSRTSNTSVTVGTINTVDPDAAVKKLREMQQDALAVAGIR